MVVTGRETGRGPPTHRSGAGRRRDQPDRHLRHLGGQRPLARRRQERGLDAVHHEGGQLGDAEAERTGQPAVLLGQVGAEHVRVVGVDRDDHARLDEGRDRVVLQPVEHAGAHVRRRAHLERDAPFCELGDQGRILDGAHAVTDPLGPQVVQGGPDAVRAVALARRAGPSAARRRRPARTPRRSRAAPRPPRRPPARSRRGRRAAARARGAACARRRAARARPGCRRSTPARRRGPRPGGGRRRAPRRAPLAANPRISCITGVTVTSA